MEKPPLGVKPAWAVNEERLRDVCAAVVRYKDANEEVPKEWLEELESLTHAIIMHRIQRRGIGQR